MTGRHKKILTVRQGRWLSLAILLTLLFVSAGIEFSHTENNGTSSPSCPACTYHLTGVADAVPICLVLPEPTLNGMVISLDVTEHDFLTTTRLAARSPPLA